MRENGLERAIAAAGGVSALSRSLGVSQPAVSGWKRIPPDRVLAVEAATGIARTTLRPDLYAEAELPVPDTLDEISAARADTYALLAHLLWRAPDAALLRRLAVATPGDGLLAQARRDIGDAAATCDATAVEREHFNLFTGLGGGELMPYASYYLTGFVHERPLAEVRADLHRLGLVRTEGLSEPEDHIAFLCEVMAGLIRRNCGTPDLTDEVFFARHILPWAGRCFADIEVAEAAGFYRPVGRLGRLLIDIETQAFALPT
jgi:TorA maturation chaperone TorD